MAVEAARGCGFRKVGGLYLTGSYVGVPCCRLPSLIDSCPTCGAGVKFTRSIQWVKAALLFKEPARCIDAPAEVSAMRYLRTCPLSTIETSDAKHALMWVGEAHYPTPDDFEREANTQGISKRIAQFPKGLVLGKTRVFLAHKKAVPCPMTDEHSVSDKGVCLVPNPDEQRMEPCPGCHGKGAVAGVFSSFVPQRLERVVTETMKRIAEQWADWEMSYKSAIEEQKRMGTVLAGPWSGDGFSDWEKPEVARAIIVAHIVAYFRAVAVDLAPETVEGYEWVKDDLQRGITLVAVPDGDLDHAPRARRAPRALPPAAPARPKRAAGAPETGDDEPQATLEVE